VKKAKIPSWHDTEESIEERTRLFEELIHPNINLVYRLSIRFSNRPQDIDENYNECLANLFRYIHTYDPEKSLANWIFICCKRLIYDLDCKRAQFKTTDDLNPENIVSHYAEEPSGVSGNNMGLDNYREFYNDDILRAIDRLSPIYREALLLQQAGYKLEEIMEIVHRNGSLKNPNLETVKSRLFLAKLKMRQMIDRDGNSRDNDE
jgi:RNA polymerase sigma factor (sigma-70 family)